MINFKAVKKDESALSQIPQKINQHGIKKKKKKKK